MKEQIISNLDNPRYLEKLYRDNQTTFRMEFNRIYPDLKDTPTADFWNERLNYEQDLSPWGDWKDLRLVLLAALLAGIIAKLPEILQINEEFFYQRNIGFIVFPFLVAFFARKNEIGIKRVALIGGTILLSALFINSLPDAPKSDTLILSCMHLLLFLWVLTGYAFQGHYPFSFERRLDYLRYNGDLIVMCTLIVIAGGILTGVTIGLFSLIGLKIEEFYARYVVVLGLAAVPIVGTYLTQTIPQLVQKVSPVIARLFSPLVLVTLLVYLAAIIFSGKDPYNDRDFLIIFNVLLVGVMAIIFFSIAESDRSNRNQAEIMILFLLSALTVIVNGIALSAILFRISEWGITPNRAAVLGSNILVLINLVLVIVRLLKVLTRESDIARVGKSIADYLPVYFVWAAIVTFLFPLLFNFR